VYSNFPRNPETFLVVILYQNRSRLPVSKLVVVTAPLDARREAGCYRGSDGTESKRYIPPRCILSRALRVDPLNRIASPPNPKNLNLPTLVNR